MIEVQVGDGNGIEAVEIADLLSRIVVEIKRTSDTKNLRSLVLRAVDLKLGQFNNQDDYTIHFPDHTKAQFGSDLLGPPDTPILGGAPPYFANYWVSRVGDSHSFVAHYGQRGWSALKKDPDGRSSNWTTQNVRWYQKLRGAK